MDIKIRTAIRMAKRATEATASMPGTGPGAA